MNNVKMNEGSVLDENNGIKEFVNRLVISEEVAANVIKMIDRDLKSTFKESFPYEIIPFGSYVNGLRCMDSDLDVCLRIAPLVSSYKQVPVLNRIKKLLYKNLLFNRIVHISKAKVPILKFKHVPTSVDCDLSVDNEIGVTNTFLVKSYLSMNSNLKSVVLVLKYLLVLNNLKGTGKITTYILFWMVVFYMQQLDLLPPVKNARESAPVPRFISGWNCSIPKTLPEPIDDPYSIRHHVERFCEFYDNFDFSNLAICPYLACEVLVENLASLKLPSEIFSSYINNVRNATVPPFTVHIMNVQDPTSLNANLTRPVSQQTFDMFKFLCHCTVEYLSQNRDIPLNEILKKKNLILSVELILPASVPVDVPGPSKAKRRKNNKKSIL